MKTKLIAIFTFSSLILLSQEAKTIHVFVALCDNLYQGIVPVPERIGNGQDPKHNLYWGAGYGIRNYFDRKTDQWELVDQYTRPRSNVLESCLFKHKTKNIYMLADAYDGSAIYETNVEFLEAASGSCQRAVIYENTVLHFGESADLVCYIGHTGLMDFSIEQTFVNRNKKEKDAIMLSCYSKDYFETFIKQSGANPLVWSTHLMAPEAYTLAWALEGWVNEETDEEIAERAAKAYHHYQKCGLSGARKLLTTGY